MRGGERGGGGTHWGRELGGLGPRSPFTDTDARCTGQAPPS